MSKAETRRELPDVKVQIITKPATAARLAYWQRFWERLLTRKVASVSKKES